MDIIDLSQSVLKCVRSMEEDGVEMTAEALASYLARDDRIRDVLGDKESFGARESKGGKLASGEKAFRLLREAEEEIEEWRALLKELFILLSPLVTLPDDRQINKNFKGLKKSIIEQGDIREARHSLDELKKALLAHDVSQSEGHKKRTKGGLWSFLGEKNSDLPEILKDTLIRILKAVGDLIPDSKRPSWKKLLDNLSSSNGNLESTLNEVVKFFTQLTSDIENERTQLRLFITELGKNLVEIEKHLTASLESRDKIKSFNQAFHRSLDNEIEDLRNGTFVSKSLEDLKRIVLAKVALIRKAIEEKRKYEEIQERELDVRMKRLQKDLAHINMEIHLIQTQKEMLEREALTDPLTGVMNRRAYERRILEEWERFKRYGHVFSILVIDVDHFKDINDRYGHIAGDLILKELTKRIKNHLRRSDLIFRYGGEEFVVLLPGTNADGAKEVGEKIRKVIESTKFIYKGSPIKVTLSVGVSQVKESDESSTAVFDRADAALYRAKNEGRNRVVSSEESRNIG